MNQQRRISLLPFLEERGRSLEANGSAERGLLLADALQFIDMLRSTALNVLGIERWDLLGEHYEMQSLNGWIPEERKESWVEAREFLLRGDFPATTLFTIQY